MFLYYILIKRILAGEVTAFDQEESRTFIFRGRRDVTVYISNEWIDICAAGPGAWLLSDSNSDVILPRHEFRHKYSKYFVVQATPPQPGRWKSWSKELEGSLTVMNMWTWPEIYIGA